MQGNNDTDSLKTLCENNCGRVVQPRWPSKLQFGIKSHVSHIEPKWATNVEFRVKIAQGFEVHSARRALGEHLGCVQKLTRNSSLINHIIYGIGPQSKIWAIGFVRKKVDHSQPFDLKKVHDS